MFNLNETTNENNEDHNKQWSNIADHPYRILITGGSGSEKNKYITQFDKRRKNWWTYWHDLCICQRLKWIQISIINQET